MQDLNNKIVETAKQLHTLGFLAACDGNISCKISDDEIIVTPAGKPKAFLTANEMAVVNQAGDKLKGSPSSELAMHLQVYSSCPKAQAVIHCHPPLSIAWSLAFPNAKELPNDCISELILAVGQIPIVPYSRPGTHQMGDNLKPFLPQFRVMILARHGALCWGENLTEAYLGVERLEHSVKILKAALDMNPKGLISMPDKELNYLKDIRQKMGDRTL